MVIRRTAICLLLLAVLGLAPRGPSQASHAPLTGSPLYFAGQLLVASPEIRDPRFRKSVIYMVKHNAEGAHGIILNKIIGTGTMADLLERFAMDPKGATGNIDLHFGGPVDLRRAFILHSSDYKRARSRRVSGTISFSTDIAVLRAMADGTGPRRALLALGYSGWGAGQLEDEIERGDWSLAKASDDLVFGKGDGDVWERIIDASRVPL